MNKKLITIFVILAPLCSFCQKNLRLWYKKPATVWTAALPLGNGRLGAMVYGRVDTELIQLNDATLWSGGPVRTHVNPDAYDNLLLARKALMVDEDYQKGAEYAKKMQGYYSDSYLPLGDLTITHNFKDTVPTSYFRDLNIRDAIATTRFTIDGTEYTRQVITSNPDQVIVIHLTASRVGKLNFKIGTSSQLKYQNVVISGNEIAMKGKAPVPMRSLISYFSISCSLRNHRAL